MVVSGEPREGKTISSANLAAAFAETGMTVAAVDCDFRCPNLNQYLQAPTHEPHGKRLPAVPGVTFVPTAPKDRRAHPADVIARQRTIIEYLRTRADVVVLDVAPLLITNDAAELFSLADVALIVVRAGQTRIHSAERVRDLLARHTVPVAGAVVVAADVEAMAYYDYYVMGRDAYLSSSTGFSPRSEAAPPAPRDTGPRKVPATPAVSTVVAAPPRAMSVKELLKTTAPTNGSNGNGAHGNGRGSHD
jgi:Mrp family chromosome partitioning ATPase